jgi:hypothetical protein
LDEIVVLGVRQTEALRKIRGRYRRFTSLKKYNAINMWPCFKLLRKNTILIDTITKLKGEVKRLEDEKKVAETLLANV